MPRMKICRCAIVLCAACTATFAQSPPPENGDAAQLQNISKHLDELNTKVDALSQEILKIEQQLNRPGVIVGQATPAPAETNAPVAETAKASSPPGTNTHTIAKGETLTSIAKMHKVSVDELQKANHIENDRKLQVGQTILIPSASAAPSPAASGSPQS